MRTDTRRSRVLSVHLAGTRSGYQSPTTCVEQKCERCRDNSAFIVSRCPDFRKLTTIGIIQTACTSQIPSRMKSPSPIVSVSPPTMTAAMSMPGGHAKAQPDTASAFRLRYLIHQRIDPLLREVATKPQQPAFSRNVMVAAMRIPFAVSLFPDLRKLRTMGTIQAA